MSKFNTKATKSVENLQHVGQGSQNGAPGATMEPQGLHKCKTHIKNSSNLQKKHTRRCPKGPNKDEKPYTHKQPTKETKRDTKKQTIEQTHTRTRASNCKHKHKLPRPGDRRRRRRSVAALRTYCRRVGRPLAKNLSKSFRTDKVNSLGACTHRPFAKVPKTFVKHHF